MLPIDTDPHVTFQSWYHHAAEHVTKEFEAATLATADRTGQPAARTVLIKNWDNRGYHFYTNLGSRKSADLAQNPRAALLFFWRELDRQIRIEGEVELLDPTTANAYFAARSRLSQLGAWASRQSKPLDNYADLESEVAKWDAVFAGQDVPRPRTWSGFRIIPHRYEFWVGQAGRLHRRWEYNRESSASWPHPNTWSPPIPLAP